ncbi:uncharacterized protein PAC_18356 [Phialocephala subalpina]|uniref:Uncharacterized protein n=1 Tax=Phialocephala subalpina TaxID=576137 RepID=A0A1L7XU07_9HELO|nr:uncharacterized protein PAC_18356 [Phialocephala subalpina]
MDPLSITASVIAVIGAAKQTYKALLALYSLRNAPQEVLELINEVSELQALLCLVQKATGNSSLSTLPSNDQDFIKRLIESAREPLNQLNDLITACSRSTDADAAKRGAFLNVSFATWLKSRNSIEKIRQRFLRAHRNISTALAALNNIHRETHRPHRQEDNRLMLNIHELILSQTKKAEAQTSTAEDELIIYRQFSRALVERMNETVTRSDASTIVHPKHSTAAQFDKLDSQLHEESGETRWLVSEKEVRVLEDHSGNLDHTETFSSIRASLYRDAVASSTSLQLSKLHSARSGLMSAHISFSTLDDEEGLHVYGVIQRLEWTISVMSHEFLQLLREQAISGNDMADDDGTSLLIYALKFRSHEIVGLLLDYGANPHLSDPRGISACAYAQSSLLIDRPSQRPVWSAKMDLTMHEPSITDDLCFTPLHHVVIGLKQADLRQQLNITTMYIKTPDSFGRSLLHWAVIMGDSTDVEALLDHGASPTCVDREQMTPLHDIHLAPPSSQAQCGRLLLGAGAEVDALDFWGRTPLRIAVGYNSISLDFLTLLINKGADVNRRDLYSQGPLLKSIQGRKEITRLLLKHGADTAASDGYGNTPVLEAIYRNKPQQLQLLLEHGAKTNEYFELKPGRRARDGQIHLLDFVAWYGSVEIMRILEDSPTQHYHLSQPLDTFEQYRDFRLVNGRKAEVAEHEAFLRLLSKMEFSYETCQPSHFADDESDDDENFVDAHDSILDENV